MKYQILAAVALGTVAATPSLAKDGSPYIGIEGGLIFPQKQDVRGSIDFTNPATADVATTDIARVKHKRGYDVDLIGGYDFGMFRLEGELGYKRAKTKSVDYDSTFIGALNAGSGNAFTSADYQPNDHTSVRSAMVNGLVDFGTSGIGLYAGAGAGYANVKQFGESNSGFAWQLLAGAYAPVSDNIDVGLKYRYFRAGKADYSDSAAFSAGATTCGALPCSGGTLNLASSDRFASHSLLASLVYNFAAPVAAAVPVAAPPPPPPAAAATQTCPDGSVILATDACPAPPPPPPPPPPTPGERGR